MGKISLKKQYEGKPRKKGRYVSCPQCGGTITGNQCDYCGTVFYDILNLSFDEPTIMRFEVGGKYRSMLVRVESIEVEMSNSNTFYADDTIYYTMPKEELHIIASIVPDDDNILHVSYDPECDPRE